MDPQVLAALVAALSGGQTAPASVPAPAAAAARAPAPTVTITAPICEVTRADGAKKYLMGDCEVSRVTGGPVQMKTWKRVRYSSVVYTAQGYISATGHARVLGAATPTSQPYTPGAGASIATVDAADATGAVDAADAVAPESPLC